MAAGFDEDISKDLNDPSGDNFFSKNYLGNVESDFVIRDYFPASIIYITVFVILLTIYFFFLRRKISKGNHVLIVGPSCSGKTVLFGKLVTGKTLDTYVSMKENQGNLILSSQKEKRVKLIDIPGDQSIRLHLFDRFKNLARALVFVLDASTLQKDVKDTAEMLYSLLTDNVTMSQRLPLLIVCNKQDLLSAKSAVLVRSALENELRQLRATQDSDLGVGDGSKKRNLSSSGHLTFERLEANPTKFVELDGKSPQEGLDKIKEWISLYV